MAAPNQFNWKLTIKLNIAFLNILGFWPESNDTYQKNKYTLRATIYITVFFLIGFITQIVNIFFIFDDLVALTGSIYLLLTEVLFFFKAYFLVKNMTVLKKLMNVLECDLFQPKDRRQILLIQPNLYLWKINYMTFMGMCLLTNLFWAVFPLLDSSEERKRLPFLSWYPYDTNISPFYELTYVHQIASYTYTCYAHLNIDTLITALNTFIGCQFDILCDTLKGLKKSDVEWKLIKCVKHHLLILSFAKASNNFFNWIILFQFALSAVITGLTMFQLTIVKPLTTEFFNFVSYGVAVVVQIFMYCWFGNEVHIKSSRVPNAAFECDWTDFPLKMQRNLMFVILRSQKPVTMSAMNVFYLSTQSFVTILKTAWSYFALLQQVSD